MSAFSEQEVAFLAEGKLGRLATIDPGGFPHVVPVGWRHNPELDTIDVGGRDPESTQKLRNAQRTRRSGSSWTTSSRRGSPAASWSGAPRRRSPPAGTRRGPSSGSRPEES